MNDFKEFLKQRDIRYTTDAAIAPYLTMGIGGNVGMIIEVFSTAHLRELLVYLSGNRARFDFHVIVLGGGSNVIFPDHAPNLVVIINRTLGIFYEPDFLLNVSSGLFLDDLMIWNVTNAMDGMDFLAGIPGTVGGAVAVNAGAFGQSVSSLVEKAEIFTRNGEIKIVDKEYFGFTYRDSAFKHGEDTILTVSLKYLPGENASIHRKVQEKYDYRKKNHPCSTLRSAGCFFKNPVINGEKIPAGRLIENLGLKGQTFDTLRISDQHANFVINNGCASFADVVRFENDIVQKVLDEKGIRLEREVIYISPEGKKY
ncbi:MAG: UDP-N-acetylmuramate dehydrogenase [Candidatus Omnitrophota bacterium]